MMRLLRLALLASLVSGVTLLADPPGRAQAACNGEGDYTSTCWRGQPGLPVGYNNPPQHHPSRCEIDGKVGQRNPDGTPMLDKDGDPVVKYYSEIVPTEFDVFLDTQPTGTPVAPKSPKNGGEKGFESWRGQFPGLLLGDRKVRHEFQLFATHCEIPDSDDAQPDSTMYGWVKIVSAENMVDDLFLRVTARMSDVDFTWPTVSPTHGWQMVKVPLEIRGEVPASVSESMSASNLSGSLSISISATPSHVVFESGDDDRAVICPVEALSWAVPRATNPSACSYTYRHSSVQRGGQPFTTETITVWTLQTPDPTMNGAWPLPPVSTDLLVAETQALVTG